jgi:hypothetical protein
VGFTATVASPRQQTAKLEQAGDYWIVQAVVPLQLVAW